MSHSVVRFGANLLAPEDDDPAVGVLEREVAIPSMVPTRRVGEEIVQRVGVERADPSEEWP